LFIRENLLELRKQIDSINYGLTLGIHSRIDRVIETVINNSNVGNTYINRNIVGAVVGSQPFGGTTNLGLGQKQVVQNILRSFAMNIVFLII
jgi:RHH-type proline utilization regulon transcriptional repressor/proline dehydrogenase/delta 1-pyrroline-5-carboxylate dehydrogenase